MAKPRASVAACQSNRGVRGEAVAVTNSEQTFDKWRYSEEWMDPGALNVDSEAIGIPRKLLRLIR